MNEKKRSAITVLPVYKVKSDKVDALIAVVMETLPIIRSQPACINIDVHQDPQDPTRFMVYENWTSKEELDAWLASPACQTYIARLNPLFEGTINTTGA